MKWNTPTYKKCIEQTKCICINDRLENRPMYLYYAHQINMINASTTHTKYNHSAFRFVHCSRFLGQLEDKEFIFKYW